MNQLENNRERRISNPGRSRGEVNNNRNTGGYSTRNTGRSSSGDGSSHGSSSYRSGQAGRMNAAQNAERNSAHRRKKGPDYEKITVIGVVLLVLITCIALVLKAKGRMENPDETSTAAPTETEITKGVKVDGITTTGMSRNQARNAILKEYAWSMTATYGDSTYDVTDLVAEKVDALLKEIYGGEPEENYTLDMDGMEEAAAKEVTACAVKWDKKAKNGSIDSFDKEKSEFVFKGEENGSSINQEQLTQDIVQVMKDKKFDAAIKATGSETTPDISAATAEEEYKTIGTFTTKTTANKNHNTSIRLATEALNGTVVHPGEEFSFNSAVEQRTEARGYKGVAAYNNGEVVQEIGDGVCQVSTTLYNAIYRSGLGEESISFRCFHTFEPNYIIPEQDATVSWEQPDFRFRNTTSTSIGTRASYGDQKMTASVCGIPILEDGMKLDLESKRVEDPDSPAPTYQEDQALQSGVEVQRSVGTMDSRWEMYKVIHKDGKEVSRELDHKTTYKGRAPVILRSTTGVVLAPEETTPPADTAIPTVDGIPGGYVPGDNAIVLPAESTPQENGPGVDPTAAPAATPTAAPSSPAPSTPRTESSGSIGPGGDNAVIVASLKQE